MCCPQFGVIRHPVLRSQHPPFPPFLAPFPSHSQIFFRNLPLASFLPLHLFTLMATQEPSLHLLTPAIIRLIMTSLLIFWYAPPLPPSSTPIATRIIHLCPCPPTSPVEPCSFVLILISYPCICSMPLVASLSLSLEAKWITSSRLKSCHWLTELKTLYTCKHAWFRKEHQKSPVWIGLHKTQNLIGF